MPRLPADHGILIESSNLVEYFHSTVDSALNDQRIDVEPATAHYLVNLLSHFSRSEHFYEHSNEGVQLKPLALMYADAVNEVCTTTRYQTLRRLGDVALFICGVFSQSLNRKVVDVDYYAAMGGGAYAYLSEDLQTSPLKSLASVFSELSEKFTECVDVLSQVRDSDQSQSDRDVMRIYELWLRTGSERARAQLQEIGIEPAANNVSRQHH